MINKFLIKHPIITEKASSLSNLRKYIFLVDKKATALEIKKLINSIYKVDVIKVHIINVKSKPKKIMRRTSIKTGSKSGYKKAIVTLKVGQKLDILSQ